MIHLSRSVGEAIAIGDGVTVTVLEIDGDNAVLAIDYPEGTEVERGECSLSALDNHHGIAGHRGMDGHRDTDRRRAMGSRREIVSMSAGTL